MSCLDKPQSAIPGGLPLSSGLRLTDFSGDSTPSLHALRQGSKDIAMVAMRENGQPWLKEVENVHSLYGLCVVCTNLATELGLLFTMTAIMP